MARTNEIVRCLGYVDANEAIWELAEDLQRRGWG